MFSGLGICCICGDMNGPWVWVEGRWICEDCYEKNNFKKQKNDTSGDSEKGISENI